MNGSVRQSFWFHLLLVILVFLFIYVSFFFTLGFLTHHGEQINIPNLHGKNMYAAIDELHKLNFDVHVDSLFDPNAKPQTVLKQVPDTGSLVKSGRIVMITVNSVTPQRVPMPNLISLSYRSAEMLLKNNKMFVGDTTYVPDIARGAIKEQKYKGAPIRPGELIAQGSRIDLIIGNGLGNTEFDVPDVIRLTIDEALATLNQYNLIPNYIVASDAGDIYDTASAYIVRQIPEPRNETGGRNKIKMGDVIDLYIKQRLDDVPKAPPADKKDGNNTPDPNVVPDDADK